MAINVTLPHEATRSATFVLEVYSEHVFRAYFLPRTKFGADMWIENKIHNNGHWRPISTSGSSYTSHQQQNNRAAYVLYPVLYSAFYASCSMLWCSVLFFVNFWFWCNMHIVSCRTTKSVSLGVASWLCICQKSVPVTVSHRLEGLNPKRQNKMHAPY